MNGGFGKQKKDTYISEAESFRIAKYETDRIRQERLSAEASTFTLDRERCKGVLEDFRGTVCWHWELYYTSPTLYEFYEDIILDAATGEIVFSANNYS